MLKRGIWWKVGLLALLSSGCGVEGEDGPLDSVEGTNVALVGYAKFEKTDDNLSKDAWETRNYVYYRFEDELTRRLFRGLIMLPELSKLLGDTKALKRDNLGNYLSGWHQDGSVLRSVIADSKLRSVNVLGVAGDGTLSSALDIDGDGVVDVMDLTTPTGQRHVFVTEHLGLPFFDAWLKGYEPFCPDVAQAFVPHTTLPGFGCPGEGGSAGGGASQRGIVDPLDVMCEGVSKSPRGYRPPVMAHGGHHGRLHQHGMTITQDESGRVYRMEVTEVYRDDEGNHVSTHRRIVDWNQDGNVSRVVQERVSRTGRGTRTTTELGADGTKESQEEPIMAEIDENGFITDTQPTSPPPVSPGASEGGAKVTTFGPDGRGGDHDSALAEFCTRRAERRPSSAESIADADHSTVDTDCDDPVINPASRTVDDNCGIQWAGRDEMKDVLDVHAPSSNCGPYEQPGPDGTCGSASAIDRLRGNAAWIGRADLPEFKICNPIVCNPGS